MRKEEKEVKRLIDKLLPLPIGMEVYVEPDFFQGWLRGKITGRWFSKRWKAWIYRISFTDIPNFFCIRTIKGIKFLEEEDKHEKGREESN